GWQDLLVRPDHFTGWPKLCGWALLAAGVAGGGAGAGLSAAARLGTVALGEDRGAAGARRVFCAVQIRRHSA
ncbi:MAG: hypothetical protein KA244_06590, partial [Deltaproteobacteria bacterium]|nr:hypothetical protein [Deltaproteobacteria bacterium]